ncbi:N-acyl homoserine lactone synthase [uncultured archaeon]|nr:N-acyl homoserine lactone synthase [uncultured archaeon]HKJ96416.1 FAD/NAD(P)-binding oxidoreductase [Thermoplasmataceae archaeon]
MFAPTRIIIVGDGSAGIMLANKLRFLLRPREASIAVVGKSTTHYFKSDGITIPVGLKRYKDSVKETRFLFNHGVDYIEDEIANVNIEQRSLTGTSGRTYSYDYLVLASGTRFAYEDIPGYEGEAKHFYSLQDSLNLREHLKTFRSGDIVIGQPDGPFQYPPGPFEFAMMLDEYLRRNGTRDKTNIHFLSPSDRAFDIKGVSDHVEAKFEEKGINLVTNFKVSSVNAKNKELTSKDGDSAKYGLLVLVPPHKGQRYLGDSGLAGEDGFVLVDKNKLNYKDYDDVFAIGDTANIPVAKSGASAKSQAEFLASRITHELVGNPYDKEYNGDVYWTTMVGDDRALSLYFSYEKEPRVSFASKADYLLKWASSDTYFSGVVRGIL